ncbi:RNA polymerase sigma factor [Streptomyces sp. NPDC050448]|uniref:RNA polymerase sigma factor n=1 Tax=Streptomyces sp. NPDC050448 TaxID=3155404 RepID=UPI00344A80FE
MADDHGPLDFDTFFRHSYQRLLAKAFVACGGNYALAQDVVQEAFIVCWRRMTGPAGHHPPVTRWYAWLATVVVREALAALRRTPAHHPLEGIDPYAPLPEPAAHLDLKDAYRRACAAIARLSEQQRAAVALCCLADLSGADAAVEMGISASTVRVHLTRARRTLGPLWEELESMGVFDDPGEGGQAW